MNLNLFIGFVVLLNILCAIVYGLTNYIFMIYLKYKYSTQNLTTWENKYIINCYIQKIKKLLCII